MSTITLLPKELLLEISRVSELRDAINLIQVSIVLLSGLAHYWLLTVEGRLARLFTAYTHLGHSGSIDYNTITYSFDLYCRFNRIRSL